MSKNTGLIVIGLAAAGVGAYFLFNKKTSAGVVATVTNNLQKYTNILNNAKTLGDLIAAYASFNPTGLSNADLTALQSVYTLRYGILSSRGGNSNGGSTIGSPKFKVTTLVKLVNSTNFGVVQAVLAPGQMLTNEYAYKVQFAQGMLSWEAESQLLLYTPPPSPFHVGEKVIYRGRLVTVTLTSDSGYLDPGVVQIQYDADNNNAFSSVYESQVSKV